LELRIYTFTDFIDDLKQDYNNLKNEREKLCQLEESFFETDDIAENIRYAVTRYGKGEMEGGYVKIEVADKYFEQTIEIRKIMLLHELIHACQRPNELLNLGKKCREILAKFYGLMTRYYLQQNYEQARLQEISGNLNLIRDRFLILPFEMWNDIFFRDTFPDLFPYNISRIYENISSGIDKLDLKNAEKYPVFAELLRATYLTKITDGMDISSKFYDLSNFWKGKLNDIVENEERHFFDSSLNSLSDISYYPDPTMLEKKYEEFANQWWDDEVGTIS